MVSMKVEEDHYECCEPNQYGYGLSLYLNEERCEMLGIKTPIKPGTKVTINAMAVVIMATESAELDGDDKGNDITINLQITDLELTGTKAGVDAATALYGSADNNE